MTRQVTNLKVIEKSVGAGNWNSDRKPVDTIIIHTIVGTAASANSRFNIPNEQVSAHYGVCLNGDIWHWVDEDQVAFHAGNYAVNQRSIGIEHEDKWNGKDPEPARPDILYQSSGKLVKEICGFYGIPIDRQHIKGHREVSATLCPGALDIDRIIKEAVGTASGTAPNTVAVDKVTFEKLVFNSTEYDKFVAGGFKTVQDATSKIKGLNQRLGEATDRVREFEKKLLDQEEELSKWRKHICKEPYLGYSYNETDILLDKPLGMGLRIIRYAEKNT